MIVIPKDWQWKNGIGFLPFNGDAVHYNRNYFQEYVKRANSLKGKQINDIRCGMVEGWCSNGEERVLDVGIGCGSFIEAMVCRGWDILGTDVNPYGLEWLSQRNRFYDPQDAIEISVLTFWDVLEHIPAPETVFEQHPSLGWIFMSMPIYENEDSVFTSRHFKPGEHCWYFTQDGLLTFMEGFGFDCVEINKKETILVGRDEVYSFAFQKVRNEAQSRSGIPDQA